VLAVSQSRTLAVDRVLTQHSRHSQLKEIFDEVKSNTSGHVATYIPQVPAFAHLTSGRLRDGSTHSRELLAARPHRPQPLWRVGLHGRLAGVVVR